MKKLLLFFMCAPLLFASSCSSDDDNEPGGNGKVAIKVTARYEKIDTGAEAFADKGAKVFLFFDLTPGEGYTYKLGGTYSTPSGDITADQSATIGEDGTVTIDAKFTNKAVAVITESKYYAERYDQAHIGKLTESQSLSAIFRP